jgi:hypothetical protein
VIDMPKAPAVHEVDIYLELIDQGYNRKAWHGPNLRGSIRGMSAAEAEWRPGPNRKSIVDNVLHAAYWKYAVRRRITGDKRGSFALKGHNWFITPDPLGELRWQEYVDLLDDEHKALRAVIAAVPASSWHTKPAGSKDTISVLALGIAAHDVYHTGQIQLLKRLYADEMAFS